MFSPPQSISASQGALQQPRRRRNRVNDSEAQAPPRKRTRITSNHYRPNADRDITTNGIATINGNGSAHKDIPLRETRSSGSLPRVVKTDSSIVLSKTPKFTVTSIPSLPEKLRKPYSGDFCAFFRLKPYSHLAIAVTTESVLIWDCSISSSSPIPRTLTLPYPLKPNDRIPLAAAVTNPSKDLGLVLVYPSTGKITYWENIDSAESLKLFDYRRQGVEGNIKIWSSEHVVDILDTETTGLVVSTSSGRLVHITLQDSYGNPHISSNFLYGVAKGSFFGDLVNVFQRKIRVNSVRSRQISKGRVEILALEEDGIFKVWETSEASQANYIGDYDLSQLVRNSFAEQGIMDEGQKYGLKFLSFSQVRSISNEVLNDAFALHCLILVEVDLSSKKQLLVLEAMITSARQSIDRICPISVYTPQQIEERAQMIFSGNEETIFIVHGLSIIVLSWPLPKETIEDRPIRVVNYFQDSINFSNKKTEQILAVSTDEQSQSGTQSRRSPTGVLVFIKPARILRITPNIYNPKIQSPNAESKLEQKVFFGTIAENPLDMDNSSPFNFSTEQVEAAALLFSLNILKTGTDFLPQSASSMDQHLTLRMKVLQDLATYLKKFYPDLSRATKWKLLFDAEKLAAARAIWRRHDQRIDDGGAKEISLIDEAVDIAIERHMDDGRSQIDDGDDLRLWFTKHVHNIEKLFPICFGLIKAKNRAEDLNTEHLLRLTRDMNDLVVSALGAAFDFRQRHLSIYGLENEDIDDGILLRGYEGLPKFWTSDSEMLKAVSWSIDLSHEIVSAVLSKAEDAKSVSSAIVDQANSLAIDMDVVVKLSCKSYIEGYRWLVAQDSIEDRNKGLDMKNTFETKIRHDQIVALYDMGQGKKALVLAEELEDVPALVDLSLLELDDQKARRSLAGKNQSKILLANEGLSRIEKQITHYFRKFGQKFARPFYQGQVSTHRLADLIDKDLGLDDQRTIFLRTDSSCAKLAWINDAVNENDLVQVGSSLMEVAKGRENNTWSKGLELSLAKLALRSIPGSREPSVANNEVEVSVEAVMAQQLLQKNQREISIWKIQQQLYAHIRPSILEAVDEDGALENVMQLYATETIKIRPALAQLLKLGFSDLISHRTMTAESLIDVLSLMDQVPPREAAIDSENSSQDQTIFGKETLLALKVLDAADMEPQIIDTLQKLIWKRCLLRDDWAHVGRTSYKSDKIVDEKLMTTAAFETIKAVIRQSSSISSSQFTASIPPPDNLIGAGSSPDDYLHRFPQEELRVPIAKDNVADDQLLQTYLDSVDIPGLLNRIKELALDVADAESSEEAEKASRYNKFLNSLKQVAEDETQIKEEEEDDDGLSSEEVSGNVFDGDEDVAMESEN